jgi:hypothetical protein
MNEDDTFRVLARRPYEEVCAKIDTISMDLDNKHWRIQFKEILKESHWTVDEWLSWRLNILCKSID